MSQTPPEPRPARRQPNPTEMALLAVRGFCMGAADVVPGVSGGTIALVLGIYERLIDNIHVGASALGRLLKADVRGFASRLREVEWGFLLPLLAGIGVAVITLAHVIETALENHPVPMGALFFGLVGGSVVVAWRMIEGPGTEDLAVLAAATIVTFFALGFTTGERHSAPLLVFFLAGALAICAMILPGISGSFLLLAIGMYELVIGAVTDRDFAIVIVFSAGAVVGLSLFSGVLNWALDNHRNRVLAALTGLMLGSLRILWPWPEGIEETGIAAPGDHAPAALAIAVAAFLVVIGMAEVGRRLEARDDAEVHPG